MEIEPLHIIGAATGIGGILGTAWVVAYILSWIGAWIWSWVDECESPKENPLIEWSMRKMGWGKPKGWSCWLYSRNDDVSDGACGFFYPLLAVMIGPAAITILILLYPLTLSILLAVLLARLARFARRHKKLFDKHLKDPGAHK